MTRRQLITFLATLVLATWTLQIVGLSMSGWTVSRDIAIWLIGSMFLPAVWAGVAIFRNRELGRAVAWKPGRPTALIAAPLIPAAVAFLVLAVIYGAGWGSSGYFVFERTAVDVASGPWFLGRGLQSWPYFAANIVVTALVFGVLNSITAIGEEFGWRGFAQPHMISAFGIARGLIILGFVWGIWHLPVNLAGYNHPEYPLLGALVLFPLQLIAHSFILAALTTWARSFWPAVLFHGSVNGVYGGVMGRFVLAEGVSPLVVDLTVLAIEAALAFVAWRYLIKRAEPRDSALREAPRI